MAVPRITLRAFSRGATAHSPDGRPAQWGALEGRARLGRRTKHLVRRLRPGDIAVIDHEGIDRVAAEELVATGVRVVVNVARSTAERYPNQGPLILTEAGIHLVDMPGASLFERLEDGDRISLAGGRLLRDGQVIAEGEVQDQKCVAQAHEAARREVGAALESFAENTMAHLREERDLLAGRIQLPELETSFRDRPALIVVRGVDYQRDLRILRPYVRDRKPVLVAVDGGADAIREEGFSPHIIVGDMDSASDASLCSGAELVVHAYPNGRAPGRVRLESLGLPYKLVPAPATSEDVAMLIPAEKGASLIVTVGSHFNLVEFLDKNRRGMSSTFLTRLRVGEILVDAKGVSRLYRGRVRRGDLALLVGAAAVTLAIVVTLSEPLRLELELMWAQLGNWWFSLRQAIF